MVDLIDLRARMMCYGVKADAKTLQVAQESEQLERGFIHGTVLLLLGRIPVNTTLLDEGYSASSLAPSLIATSKRSYTLRTGMRSATYASFTPKPPFFAEQVGDARVGDYLQLHGQNTLFATPVRQCAFIAAGRPCVFCTFEQGKVTRLDPQIIASLVGRFIHWRPTINGLAFGGGSTNLRDFGARYYRNCAESVRRLYDIPISIELVPSRQDQDWKQLASSLAVDAIISSIEIWNDERRRQICLGKSDLSRDHYMRRWTQAVDILGPGNVSSVLLVGLEQAESTLEGALKMIELGVIPTLIPYRPYDSSPLGALEPVRHEKYIALSEEVATSLRLYKLDPSRQAACTGCGGCSLEHQMYVAAPLHRQTPSADRI